jgi:hypothetical protein
MTEPESKSAVISDPRKLRLPRPRRVTLRSFSLFDHAPTITAEFGDGVFCLAGANGLGKSTFLSALNFGITGIVAEPDRQFQSMPEYYQYTQQYARGFFRGRIKAADRDSAEIEVEMQVGGREYRLVRGMFEPLGLREFAVNGILDDHSDYIANDIALSATERHAIYVENVTKDSGLSSFAQLAFLQIFVLTFDERRRLLFWDDTVSQSAYFIAFGIDLQRAQREEALRRNYEKADSLAKNLQWQATDARKRRDDLIAALDEAVEDNSEDVREEHRALVTEQEHTQAQVSRLQAELQDIGVRLSDYVARRDAAKEQYEVVFRKLMLGRKPPSTHPVVSVALETSRCAICATDAPSVRETIKRRIDRNTCPLCGSSVLPADSEDEQERELLISLDNEINSTQSHVDAITDDRRRLSILLSETIGHLDSVSNRVNELEAANEARLVDTSRSSPVHVLISQYNSQISELLQRKEREVDKRHEARRELRALQAELARTYASVEGEFVPRFTALAREFLGIDLSVRFSTDGNRVRLLLTVNDTLRLAEDALSESQRFFVEIALRMALVQQMTSPESPGTLYIDTPEGSLDIAYEGRAGRMFGLFVRDGYQLIMTANINTSQLLLKLAETCGSARMRLLRMTEWTSLSEVQAAAEDLFNDAFRQIEQSLESGG